MPKANDQGTRSRILEAAVDEIAERGWGGVRTRGIADRAGVNRALVHYHFRSMDQLRFEAAGRAFGSVAGRPMVAALEAGSLVDAVTALCDAIAAQDPAQPAWTVLVEAMLQAERTPEVRVLTTGLLHEFRTALRVRLDVAVGAGELPRDTDTAGLAVALVALFDGLGLHYYVEPELDVERAGAAMAGLFDRSTEARAGTRAASRKEGGS